MIFRNKDLYIIITLLLILFISFSFKNLFDYKNNRQNQYKKKLNLNNLKDGDLIFRLGYGLDSIFAANFSNKAKDYSHVGFLLKIEKGFFVVHSVEDEQFNYNGVVKEPLTQYLQGVKKWAVYRYGLSTIEISKLKDTIYMSLNKNISFDSDFDLETDSKLYCSEFVYKVINHTLKKEYIKLGKIILGKKFVTISDLYENIEAKLIQKSDY